MREYRHSSAVLEGSDAASKRSRAALRAAASELGPVSGDSMDAGTAGRGIVLDSS